MIAFGPMSISLLIGALQGSVLAALLWRTKANRRANRFLALLILGVVSLTIPYIIGYAGFYDRWPWLSFAPFSYTMAFGPLLYFHVACLTDPHHGRVWPHFVPVLLQFLSDAIAFPLPLAAKNWWDGVAHAPYIAPFFELATLLSILIYGGFAFRNYRRYRIWLGETRADGVDFDPGWVRNFLIALLGVVLVWSGFFVANQINPARNYFDQFALYLLFALLVIYLGVEGWRNAATQFPQRESEANDASEPESSRDWKGLAQDWSARIDAEALWQQPDLTLASLARHLGTNTAYLSRAFNEGLGENFNATINRRRVAAVQQWLLNPGDQRDMMTLAFDAGFSSKASFNRAFADFAGMSPSVWRLKSKI